MEHKCEIIGTILKPFTFKTAHNSVSLGRTQWKFHSYSIYLFITFVFKHKESLFGGYVKQIATIMLWNVRVILNAVVQVVKTNITDFF